MPRPSHARRILKWTGVGLFLFIILTWVVCSWWEFAFPLHDKVAVYLQKGGVYVMVAEFNYVKTYNVKIYARRHNGSRSNFPSLHVSQYLPVGIGTWHIIPFWLLLLLDAIPTAWLWHRDRRRIRPGHCPGCGYDLTGNTSGVCPECGDKACPPAVLADSECGATKPRL